jgi:hypothetical protein
MCSHAIKNLKRKESLMMARMGENIRNKMNKSREYTSGEERVRNLINNASEVALTQFIQRIESGEIAIDNFADFMRVFGIYQDINQISGNDSGSGGTPEIDMRKSKTIQNRIDEGSIVEEEDGELNLENMSSEDMARMIEDMDRDQNSKNQQEL